MEDRMVPAAYAGVDWAMQKHDVCVVDVAGAVKAERAFPADAQGLAAMADWLVAQAAAPAAAVAVAIEVPHGPVVEALIERGFPLHAISPRQLDRFRDRFSVAGAKDDRRDARVLADSLRTDPRAYRVVELDDPDVIELREYSRMYEELQGEDVALCNRARHQLLRYFPQVLELSEDPGEAWILELLESAPTPEAARRRRRSAIGQLLREHRIRRISADEVVAILGKPALQVAPGTVEAASGHLLQVNERIRLVRRQIEECHAQIEAILGRLAPPQLEVEGQKSEPRDVEMVQSLPGFGPIVSASLLAEASRPLRERDYQALRTLCGTAPVTIRSGKGLLVTMRRACNRRLRNMMHHAAGVAAQRDPAWGARYRAMRAKGRSHGAACRVVADGLLRTLVAMLQTRTLYDPARPRRASAA